MNKTNRVSEQTRPTQEPVKSVLTPNAQTTTLCAADSVQVTAVMSALTKLLASPDIPGRLKAGISLMFQEGLRVSELLRIRGTDVKRNLAIVIRASKGSENRLVHPVSFRQEWQRFQGSAISIGDDYDRFFVYRLFKSYNIQLDHVSGQNRSVTHSLRYLYIRQLSADKVDLELIQKSIGHKSINSTNYYENKK